MLLGSAAALMGAYGLAPRYGLAADVPLKYDGSKFQMAAPEPNPKRGGVLRYGVLNRPPHFDVHQSGTVGNIGTQGCMFDNLIRRDPRDSGKTIVPDLRIAGKSPRTARLTHFTFAKVSSSTTEPISHRPT
jgi:hypothetical protein